MANMDKDITLYRLYKPFHDPSARFISADLVNALDELHEIQAILRGSKLL